MKTGVRAGRRIQALAIVISSFALAAFVIRYQPAVEHYIRSIGAFAYPLATVIFVAVASAPFSVTDALAIMNGALFGPLWGSVVNAIGIVLAAIVGYKIAERASSLLDLERTLERLPAWAKRFPVGSPGFLVSVRVIPGLGGTLATSVAATFKVPLFVHVWTMSAIAIPLCVLLAIFGDRVTFAVHNYEHRAQLYYQKHGPHFHLHRKHTHP
ncbi:MAG: hypothetical protein M3Z14_04870 [Candidatus Eremiobacteraeota bacterium]|nr:hypothetical protein [Candidatus Eremiobacteraeota bacterium]